MALKLPNGYGQIIKLGGKRRRPYAVRISAGHKDVIVMPNKAECYPFIDKYDMQFRKDRNNYAVDATDRMIEEIEKAGVPYWLETKRKYKYLEYFSKSKDAYEYLSQMNRGEDVRQHTSLASEPSFKDVYDMYIGFAKSLNKPPSVASLQAYKTGFNLWADVHDIRFRSVTTKQLQDCLTAHGSMSKASVTRMITILKKMYKYGIAHQICDRDLSPYLFAEHTDEQTYIHDIYTDEEIDRLWATDTEAAKVMLILIYTGLRCSEFLSLETANIHLDERYLTGGMKTDAGRNRIVPIHKRIDPIIRDLYDPDNKYLFPNDDGGKMLYSHFRDNKWKKYNEELGMDHYTHDCRHTCSTKLEEAKVELFHRKLILGHKITDITDGTYTHVSKETLIFDMDKWVK